jgi:hypothetical protein
VKEENRTTIRKHRITNEKMLRVIFILGIGLSLVGGCAEENDDLEKERLELVEEWKSLLKETGKEFGDDLTSFREGEGFRFFFSLTTEQDHALFDLGYALEFSDISEAAKAVNEMVELITPGMLICLVEFTKAREEFLAQKPLLLSKIQSYEEKLCLYYNQMMSYVSREDHDEYVEWYQAALYYQFLKREITGKSERERLLEQELLIDLHNAVTSQYEYEYYYDVRPYY